MSELQSTIEFSVELFKFYNVDLFQRGMYQVRSSLRASSKLSVEIEVTTPEVTTGLGSAIVLGNYGACRPFQILYRNEEVNLKDVVLFRCHMLVDGNNLRESLERAEFSLILELWFSDTSPASMVMVSSRVLQLNMSPVEGLHYHLPVLFDYFHLSAISLTVHAALTALHQPSLKKGLLRYMQSCAPKSSKSWSKIRSAHCTSLTDPVLPVSSNKVYSRINETPQVHLEAYNVLLDSSNNLRSTIRDYKHLLRQREEIVPENYDTLIVKHNDYDSTKLLKKRSHAPTSGLAELCADNIKLWNYFLLTFSCKLVIQQHLSKKHHHLRVRRFAELFFLVYNPRKSAFGCHESNYQNYLVIAEVARRSKYMQMLPPLPIHCVALDGESATMPVIFEDRYQDPFDHKRKTFKDVVECDPIPWKPKIEKIEVDSTNCSCGIGKLWETRKQLGKTLVNIDLYALEDQLAFAIPTRHSKSLDQLQVCSLDTFRHSLCNIRRPNKGETRPPGPGEFTLRRHQPTLVNVASEHDMRSRFQAAGKVVYEACGCPKRYENAAPDQSNGFCGRFDLGERPKAVSKLVKSASQTQPDSNGSMFRSNSMRSFSPEKVAVGVQKFNTLLTKKGFTERARGAQIAKPAPQKKPQSKRRPANGKRFEIGPSTSSSSSPDSSPTTRRKKTGPKRGPSCVNPGVRRARSTPFLVQESTQPALSGTESLPNITSKLEERLYPEMRYYTSTSSATSEQSGWISSRSSSIASSTDATNPAPNATPIIHENNQKKTKREACQSKPKLSLFYADSDSSNNGFPRGFLDFPSIKGCEVNQSNISSEDFALPPPKQFRDLESPSTSITNGTNEEEINAVDNLLYHVVDTTTTLEKRSSNQFNQRRSNEITGSSDFPFAKDNSESIRTFLKAKKEFKSQLNFPGLLYSDLDEFASTAPYFHISDEFRIFSPEGLHLVVCVHGLDGNSADLRLVKTYLELGLPGAYLDFLMSERNQGDTFSDFDTMTDRLISEILHYLDSSSIRPTRISFVGHSLGNIIIRSALTRPQMKFLLPRLHTFLSLSGPHLGTLYNSSGLVNMGMWFMQKWKKSGSLLQLCLKDSTDPRQSFLYRLSQRSTLHHFRNILLCGSGQDRYVPLHSARIELCKESLKDNTYQGKVYREMVHNILSPIIAEKKLKLLRYDIHHALPNTANALIGRAAHIAVLDSELFIEKFMVIVGIKYFR